MGDPDLELRGGGGGVLLALPSFLLSVISSFFTQNKGRGAGPPPLDSPLANPFTSQITPRDTRIVTHLTCHNERDRSTWPVHIYFQYFQKSRSISFFFNLVV